MNINVGNRFKSLVNGHEFEITDIKTEPRDRTFVQFKHLKSGKTTWIHEETVKRYLLTQI